VDNRAVDDDVEQVGTTTISSSSSMGLFVGCNANDIEYRAPYLAVNTVSISNFMVGKICRRAMRARHRSRVQGSGCRTVPP